MDTIMQYMFISYIKILKKENAIFFIVFCTFLHRYGSRLRKRQIFDSDDITFSITDDLAGNFLQDLDIATNLPDISRELDGNCPLEIAACDPKYPYRSFTGYCNNLRKPNFGKSLTTFSRILSSVYENGNYLFLFVF